MTSQPSNDDEPPINLSCYPTLEGFITCASEDPEHTLALYLKNCNTKDSSNASDDDDDEQKKKALLTQTTQRRRLRIIAWYLYFSIGDDEIWERERGEKLEEIAKQKANVWGKHSIRSLFKVVTMSVQKTVAEYMDYREEEECKKRMMLRQEVFADWKAGKHGFFYDDEDMPDLGVDDDRIFKLSLIFKEPSWQGFLEKIVREKAEFERKGR